MKLYKLSSVLSDEEGSQKHNFQWFIINRKTTSDYSKLISNYKNLEGRSKLYAEGLVDELFTEEEAKAFQIYIRNHHKTELTIQEYELPITYNGEAPTGSITPNKDSGFYPINEEGVYNLPFHAWGYYTPITNKTNNLDRYTQLVDHTDLKEFEEKREKENINNALIYLRKSLRMINPQMHVSDEQLKCISTYLLEKGFCIEKTLTKEQKVALKALNPDVRVNS